jgi:hypothetical protein
MIRYGTYNNNDEEHVNESMYCNDIVVYVCVIEILQRQPLLNILFYMRLYQLLIAYYVIAIRRSLRKAKNRDGLSCLLIRTEKS